MAAQTFAGSFSLNTSTGSQSITGVGFQPKAVIFTVTSRTSNGVNTGVDYCYGIAVSSTARACVGFNSTHNVSPSVVNRFSTNAACIQFINTTPTAKLVVDLTSLDADGFTLNITTSDSTAYKVGYWAIGGASITNVALKEFTTKTTTGSQAYTGVGFQPDAMVMISAMTSTQSTATNTCLLALGAATSSTARWASSIYDVNNQVSTQTRKTQVTDKFINSDNGSTFVSADLTSMDADGFTLNYGTTNGTARYCWALCLKGGNYKVGAISQKTSTGSQSTTGIGYLPAGLLLASYNSTSSATAIADAKISIGYTSGSSAMVATWAGEKEASNPTENGVDFDSTKVIKLDTTGASPTTDASASLTSFDSDGWTLNYAAADATAREIVYFAIGPGAVASTAKARIFGDGQLIY